MSTDYFSGFFIKWIELAKLIFNVFNNKLCKFYIK